MAAEVVFYDSIHFVRLLPFFLGTVEMIFEENTSYIF